MKIINEKIIVLLILGLLVQQHQVHGFFAMVLSLIDFAWNAFSVANTIHDTYSKFTTPSTADLMDKSEEIAESLDNWGGRIEDRIQKSVEMLLTRLPLINQIDENVQTLNFYVGRIGELYFDYRHYLKNPEIFDARDLDALIKTFTSRELGDVQGMIGSMYNLIVPKGLGVLKKSLFLLLAEESQEYSLDLCNTAGSPQQRLIQFYDVLIETEMRAYTMNIFGYTMEGYIEGTNRTAALEFIRDKLIMRAKEYLKLLKMTVGQASTIFRQCDPPEGNRRDITYHEFERFMTGFIVSQEVFQRDHTCPKTCESYSQPSRQNHRGCTGTMCQSNNQACNGRLTKCSTMTGKISYCLNNGSEARRFQWFEDESKTYGDSSNGCSGELRIAERSADEKNRRWCDICRCICLEEGVGSTSKPFISLEPQMTNVDDNMVATGVRFIVKDKILYLQVMQGKLGPLAEIPQNSTSWVEIEKFDPNADSNVQRDTQYKKTKGYEDVFTLTPGTKRINLDFLAAPKDHVITGVAFERSSFDLTSPVQLSIQATSYNAKTGQLDLESSHWIGPQDMPYAKRKGAKRIDYGKVEGKRNPAESWATKIDTAPYTFIDVDHSSMEYDAAQTVIPLIDAIPAITQPPIPIVALGLFHKKQPGYGGFLTFVLKGINMATYIPTDV